MLSKYKAFYKRHPYLNVILTMVIASIIGITIEYIVNRDFIGAGFFSAVCFTLFELLRIRRVVNKDKKRI